MRRAILIAVVLIALSSITTATQSVYPPLTRETLTGVWEALFGVGSVPVVFHIAIASTDGESYLSEIYPDHMKGRLFRLESCTIADGKVKLLFRSLEPDDSWTYWIEGEAYGDAERGWIRGTFGTQSNAPGSGPAFYAERRTWVRDLGAASLRAAEKIKEVRDGKQ